MQKTLCLQRASFVDGTGARRLYTQDLDIPKGAKVVYFVRHGEAAHNAAAVEFGKKPAGIAEDSHGQHPYRDPAMTDPKLTKRGQEQVKRTELLLHLSCSAFPPLCHHLLFVQSLACCSSASPQHVHLSLPCIRVRYCHRIRRAQARALSAHAASLPIECV
eukprot:1289017-Pleurochrysis_carterae.AAC.1